MTTSTLFSCLPEGYVALPYEIIGALGFLIFVAFTMWALIKFLD